MLPHLYRVFYFGINIFGFRVKLLLMQLRLLFQSITMLFVLQYQFPYCNASCQLLNQKYACSTCLYLKLNCHFKVIQSETWQSHPSKVSVCDLQYQGRSPTTCCPGSRIAWEQCGRSAAPSDHGIEDSGTNGAVCERSCVGGVILSVERKSDGQKM